MCGRFSSSRQPAELVTDYGVDDADLPEPLPLDYNVAPTKPLYAVTAGRSTRTDRSADDSAVPEGARRRATGGTDTGGGHGEREHVPESERAEEGQRRLVVARWGLIPSWAKDRTNASRMINARIETAAASPAFRRAFAARRCLVPADGYYEWRALPAKETAEGGGRPAGRGGARRGRTAARGGRKQPYFITAADGGGLALAGLHEFWRDPSRPPDDPAAWWHTVAVLTTDSEGPLAELHDRMPVIVTPDHYAAWLDPDLTDPDTVRSLVSHQPVDQLVAYPVSTAVNNVRVGGAELARPLPGVPGVGDLAPGTVAAIPDAGPDPDTGDTGPVEATAGGTDNGTLF